MRDGDIWSIEFLKILQEVENIVNLRLVLETKLKTKVTKEQSEELLNKKGRKVKVFYEFMTRLVVIKIFKTFFCSMYYQQKSL